MPCAMHQSLLHWNTHRPQIDPDEVLWLSSGRHAVYLLGLILQVSQEWHTTPLVGHCIPLSGSMQLWNDGRYWPYLPNRQQSFLHHPGHCQIARANHEGNGLMQHDHPTLPFMSPKWEAKVNGPFLFPVFERVQEIRAVQTTYLVQGCMSLSLSQMKINSFLCT